jgi:hypothetical protein
LDAPHDDDDRTQTHLCHLCAETGSNLQLTPGTGIVAALGRSPVRCYVTLLDIELGSTAAPEFFATSRPGFPTLGGTSPAARASRQRACSGVTGTSCRPRQIDPDEVHVGASFRAAARSPGDSRSRARSESSRSSKFVTGR